MALSQLTAKQQKLLAESINRWYLHPAAMVRELFEAEPDPWQEEVLEKYRLLPRIALPMAKGPGKTTVLAWIVWNFLLTRPFPNIACTSVTSDNLRDNLWKELAKWRAKSPLLQAFFRQRAERIESVDDPELTFCAARTWDRRAHLDEQAQTLAGLHSDYILFCIDEAGSIPDAVSVAAEAALATGQEGHIVIAGNTLKREGPLFRACTSGAGLWWVSRISGDPDDPKRSPRISLDWARGMIMEHGRDHPWVKVNVFGEFPDTSINTLIGPDEMDQARKRSYNEADIAYSPRILGLDVAREGDDECFDELTEILTDEGWKLFEDLTGNENILSVDGVVSSWQPISAIHMHEFDGYLNRCETKGINFCITDKHRLLVRSCPRSTNFVLREFRDLPEETIIQTTSEWSGENPERRIFLSIKEMPNGGVAKRVYDFDFNEWASLLGWFVSEGSVYRELREAGRLRICIGQKPGPKRDILEALLRRMGIPWQNASHYVEFTSKPIGEFLLAECGRGASNKCVPREIKDASPTAMRLFLDAFLLGDGTCRNDGTGRTYITSSKRLADDLQEMLSKLGRAGRIRMKEKAGSTFRIGDRIAHRKHDTYLVYESGRISAWGKTLLRSSVEKVRYKGKVWCVSTPKETIMVRRDGVPMWSGNSVLAKRQGLVLFPFRAWRNIASPMLAGHVSREIQDWDVDATFVDNTGGYGAATIDQMRLIGRAPIPIEFSGEATDRRFYNKRMEMHWLFVEWIKAGGQLPECPELVRALTQITYTYRPNSDRMMIEPKPLLKERLQMSPDHLDAAVLTFAQQVAARGMPVSGGRSARRRYQTEYDPYAFSEAERRIGERRW